MTSDEIFTGAAINIFVIFVSGANRGTSGLRFGNFRDAELWAERQTGAAGGREGGREGAGGCEGDGVGIGRARTWNLDTAAVTE